MKSYELTGLICDGAVLHVYTGLIGKYWFKAKLVYPNNLRTVRGEIATSVVGAIESLEAKLATPTTTPLPTTPVNP